MKVLKKATYALVFTAILAYSSQCAGQKTTTAKTLEEQVEFENQTPFKVKPIAFQEWYAGIKVGGTGINIFLSIYDLKENIVFNNVYFRNLKGELFKNNEKYMAVLKNPSPHYTFTKPEKPEDYPFTIADDECVISYTENGQLKYHKVITLKEIAGTYYENGAPSIYDNESSAGMASLDDEEEDN